MNIKGKKIIVFGGTSGIGLATIRLLLKLGVAKVTALSRNHLVKVVIFFIVLKVRRHSE